MATSTSALVDRIRILLINKGARSAWEDADILRAAVNPTAREIAALALAESGTSSITLVAGTAEYTVPAAVAPFIRMSAIYYDTDKKQIDWRDNAEMKIQISYVGRPVFWTVWGDQIRFSPTPSAGETVIIDAYHGGKVCVEQTPASNSDELTLPTDVEDALCYGSAKILASIDREVERATAFAQEYTARIGQLRQKLAPDGMRRAYVRDQFEDDVFFFTA